MAAVPSGGISEDLELNRIRLNLSIFIFKHCVFSKSDVRMNRTKKRGRRCGARSVKSRSGQPLVPTGLTVHPRGCTAGSRRTKAFYMVYGFRSRLFSRNFNFMESFFARPQQQLTVHKLIGLNHRIATVNSRTINVGPALGNEPTGGTAAIGQSRQLE